MPGAEKNVGSSAMLQHVRKTRVLLHPPGPLHGSWWCFAYETDVVHEIAIRSFWFSGFVEIRYTCRVAFVPAMIGWCLGGGFVYGVEE